MRSASSRTIGVAASCFAVRVGLPMSRKLLIGVGSVCMRLKPTNTCWPIVERQNLDLARRARSVDRERRRAWAPRARERRVCRNLESQALDSADELQLDHRGAADDGHGQLVAMLREHDVLGAHDDRSLVAAAQRTRPAIDLEKRLAELHVAETIRAEQQVRGAEERGDEARAGPLIQRARLADFLQPAAIHHADAIGHAEGFFLIVRDDDRRDSDRTLNLADGAPQLVANLRVERAERLVEQQHARLVRERASDCDALLLTARKLARQPFVVTLERHEPQQLVATAAAIRGTHATRAQRELDVVGHGHVPEQRVVLEYEADLALLGTEVRDVAAVKHDAAVIDRRQARDRAQQRALAAAGRAEENEELAVRDVAR